VISNNISSSDPAKASVAGQQVTALQQGFANLTLDTLFSVSHDAAGGDGYLDCDGSNMSNQSQFTLNIISNCTSAWTPWSACTSHQQTRHDKAGCTAVDETQACNSAPSVPNVSGPASGNISTSYDFSANGSIDPDNDSIQYQFDWGDGNISSWTSLVASGASSIASHVYASAGTYQIKTQAQDQYGAQSGWSAPFSFSASVVPPTPVPGQCKTPPNNQTYCAPSSPPSVPASSLCDKYDSARPPALSGSGPWSWTCYGQNGGSDMGCNAIVVPQLVGQCGTANGTAFCQGRLPTDADLCSSGTPIPGASSIDTNSYDISWQCQGTCGGSTVSCNAKGTKSCGWVETNP
jgi:hypothetical protein